MQNPANGIVGVYQGSDGIVYDATTIVELANDWYLNQGFPETTITQRDIINMFL
ncbi:MAG: hypothetical protein Q4C49_00595 [Bacillota bacterium]|nr:hypothetical protein [Bacillota bacterium]